MKRPGGLFDQLSSRRAGARSLRVLLCALTCAASLGGCFNIKTSELVSLSQSVLKSEVPRISLALNHYCLPVGEELKDFFVNNASTRTESTTGLQQVDLDADGIQNRLDYGGEFGLSPQSVDSDDDGLRDLPLFAVGFSLAGNGRAIYQNLLNNCANSQLDTDFDGLSDCEERLITSTRTDNFDTDGDGIPDELELRFGLNPLDAADAVPSPGGDGLRNIQKVKFNLEIAQTATPGISAYFPEYSVQPEVSNDPAKSCFTLKVSNMPAPILPTGTLLLMNVIHETANGKVLDRCCTRVLDPDPKDSQVSLTWDAATRSPELICPCPLSQVAEPPYHVVSAATTPVASIRRAP